MKTKHQSVADALGIPVEKIEEGFGDFLDALFADSEFEVISVESEKIKLDLQAGGRLVEVTNSTDVSVIPVKTSGMPFKMEMSVVKLDGHWVIVH